MQNFKKSFVVPESSLRIWKCRFFVVILQSQIFSDVYKEN